VDSPVEWVGGPASSRSSFIKVESYHIRLEGQDPFGRVADGWIRLHGHLKEAKLVVEARPNHPGRDDWVVKGDSPLLANDTMGRVYMDFEPKPGPVWCLILCSIISPILVVLLLARVSSGEDKYARIGMLRSTLFW